MRLLNSLPFVVVISRQKLDVNVAFKPYNVRSMKIERFLVNPQTASTTRELNSYHVLYSKKWAFRPTNLFIMICLYMFQSWLMWNSNVHDHLYDRICSTIDTDTLPNFSSLGLIFVNTSFFIGVNNGWEASISLEAIFKVEKSPTDIITSYDICWWRTTFQASSCTKFVLE